MKQVNEIFEELKQEADKEDCEQSLWDMAEKLYKQQLAVLIEKIEEYQKILEENGFDDTEEDIIYMLIDHINLLMSWL